MTRGGSESGCEPAGWLVSGCRLVTRTDGTEHRGSAAGMSSRRLLPLVPPATRGNFAVQQRCITERFHRARRKLLLVVLARASGTAVSRQWFTSSDDEGPGVVFAEAGRPPGACPVLRDRSAACRRRRRLLRPACVLGVYEARDDFGTCRDEKFSGRARRLSSSHLH